MSGEIDTGPLGILCAKVMDEVASEFGEDATVRTIALVVEVDRADSTWMLVRSTDDRLWVQRALLDEGIAFIDKHVGAIEQGEDE